MSGISLKIKGIGLATAIVISTLLNAQFVSGQEASIIAQEFVKAKDILYTIKPGNAHKLVSGGITLGYIYNLNPRGFVLVSTKTSAILGFSLDNDFDYSKYNTEIISALLGTNAGQNEGDFIGKTNPEVQTVGPLIKSLFGQVNCYDDNDKLINVSNLFTPNNYAPGCVAISLTTMLHHYQWPIVGMGSHTYQDKYGSSRGTYSVDFEKDTIEWSSILNKYRYQQTTQKQREALGHLVYNSAVALDMDFEYNGSTSNINRIPNTGKKYFRFISREVPASSFIFWKVVDSNLVHKMPVIFSISASNGAGHSIVCDGFKIENGVEYHHVNMGWWGNSNGWYNIKSGFNVGGYNKINHAIIDFLPVPMMNEPVVFDDSSRLEINWSTSDKLFHDAFELQLKTDTSNWTKISDTLTSKSYIIDIDQKVKEYSFRVRSKINSKWYTDSWSNTTKYKKTSTSVTEGVLMKFKVYPNPCKDRLHIELRNKSRISLLSLNGEVFYDGIHTGNTVISTGNIKKGFYILKIQNALQTYSVKLVKID